MATLTIMVRRDAGRTVVRVGFRSDADALPHEHEADHRRLVTALAGPGAEVGRERPAREPVVG